MCGIVGMAGAVDHGSVPAMNRLQRHRGPDDEGLYRDLQHGVTLAMRRLSIMDLDHGHQPMANEDQSVWLVYNGELFNAPALRRELEQRGHRFTTVNSDTEVLLRLYEEKQAEMLADLNGMFAFVVYDRRRQILFGARDHTGIKPLHYVHRPQWFAFASEFKSLLAIPSVTRVLDTASLFHYMTLRFVPSDHTIFTDIRRLPPGHCFEYHVSAGKLHIRQYWKPRLTTSSGGSLEDWSEQLRGELQAAVQRWTLSDVPIGCSLSGGLDSASLVGLLASAGHPQLKTYSLGFRDPGMESFDELPLARQVADRWGTDHHEIVLEPDELLRDLISMVWHLDEPYGGGLPSWYVFQFMARDVKVGLTGTGGDELFGDYGRYIALEQYGERWAAPKASFNGRSGKSSFRSLMESCVGRVTDGWLGWRKQERWLNWPDVRRDPFRWDYVHAFYYLSDDMKRTLVFSEQIQQDEIPDTADLLRAYCIEEANPRNGVTQLAMQTQLPEEFLLMTDRFSMAHSLEARVPFLDRPFVELVLRIPPETRTKPSDPKYLLKQTVRDLLPRDLLHAPKRGFVIPLAQWLRGKLRPLAERLLASERLARQGLFRPEFYARFVRPHLDGRADYHAQVWTALMFQLWHVLYLEQTGLERPTYSWHDLCG